MINKFSINIVFPNKNGCPKASKRDIVLNRDAAGITVLIADNGIGFKIEYKDNYAGIGLKNIAARTEYLKGTILYYSSPGKGTAVNIWVPVLKFQVKHAGKYYPFAVYTLSVFLTNILLQLLN